ncbi:hypothetical protein A2V80_01820 [Candidatus Woesebacteria bacterium RBG_16_39_8b]|uniref:Uncharacterized protein n=1 Tax=Candidatus Woesebacteria bacterium RBG_16_39_8b TaxID=1802482 RepID=A0A1F7XAJ0_9BACT|nr:MAG: hypothetical protein A2V80_01820 [Candidatus Woesebacteria bacterium RBG_16_39_8b]
MKVYIKTIISSFKNPWRRIVLRLWSGQLAALERNLCTPTVMGEKFARRFHSLWMEKEKGGPGGPNHGKSSCADQDR